MFIIADIKVSYSKKERLISIKVVKSSKKYNEKKPFRNLAFKEGVISIKSKGKVIINQSKKIKFLKISD